jgi:hypothetical protein
MMPLHREPTPLETEMVDDLQECDDVELRRMAAHVLGLLIHRQGATKTLATLRRILARLPRGDG